MDLDYYSDNEYDINNQYSDSSTDFSDNENNEIRNHNGKEPNRVFRDNKEVTCYTCNKKGHISTRCPDRKNKNDASRPYRKPMYSEPDSRTDKRFESMKQSMDKIKQDVEKIQNQTKLDMTEVKTDMVKIKEEVKQEMKKCKVR